MLATWINMNNIEELYVRSNTILWFKYPIAGIIPKFWFKKRKKKKIKIIRSVHHNFVITVSLHGTCTWKALESIADIWQSQVYKGDSRPCIPSRVMVLSAMGLLLGVFGVKCKTYVARIFAPCSKCRWYMHLMNHGYFDYGQPKDSQFEPHARIKMIQVLGSHLYICNDSVVDLRMHSEHINCPCRSILEIGLWNIWSSGLVSRLWCSRCPDRYPAGPL